MSERPSSPQELKRRRILRGVGITLSALMVVMVLTIAFFVARTEYAHDEGRCPYQWVSTRTLNAEARLVEQTRTCMPNVREQRWLIERTGRDAYELGRRRLKDQFFEPEAFRWRAELDANQQVVLHVENDGTYSVDFKEADLLAAQH